MQIQPGASTIRPGFAPMQRPTVLNARPTFRPLQGQPNPTIPSTQPRPMIRPGFVASNQRPTYQNVSPGIQSPPNSGPSNLPQSLPIGDLQSLPSGGQSKTRRVYPGMQQTSPALTSPRPNNLPSQFQPNMLQNFGSALPQQENSRNIGGTVDIQRSYTQNSVNPAQQPVQLQPFAQQPSQPGYIPAASFNQHPLPQLQPVQPGYPQQQMDVGMNGIQTGFQSMGLNGGIQVNWLIIFSPLHLILWLTVCQLRICQNCRLSQTSLL